MRCHFLTMQPQRDELHTFIRYLSVEGKEISQEVAQRSAAAPDAWTEAEVGFTVPPGAVKSQIFWGIHGNGEGPLWVDDVVVNVEVDSDGAN